MSKQLLFNITLCLLTGCEAAPEQSALTAESVSSFAAASPTPTPCELVGEYVNQSDAVHAVISNSNGDCLLSLSCGTTSWLYKLGVNQWRLLVVVADGQASGGCGLPNQSMNYNGKSGQYFDASFGYYNGIGWHGGLIPSQANQDWSKL